MRKYAYKPYHPWRHGYRRAKGKAVFVLGLKLILVAELIALSEQYIEKNTTTRVYEMPQFEVIGNDEDVYGIGFEAGKGEVFWFHKKTEMVEQEENE